MIVNVDESENENSRNTKAAECTIDYFTTPHLDEFFLATNAPRRNWFNKIESQMVKFSRELSGIVQPYKKLGFHLNLLGEKIDPELEKKNVMHEISLAEIWTRMVIDSHPVLVEYINLQIIKCLDKNCCRSLYLSYLQTVKERSLPSIIAVIRSRISRFKWVK